MKETNILLQKLISESKKKEVEILLLNNKRYDGILYSNDIEKNHIILTIPTSEKNIQTKHFIPISSIAILSLKEIKNRFIDVFLH